MGSRSPTSGSALSGESASDSFSLCPPHPPPPRAETKLGKRGDAPAESQNGAALDGLVFLRAPPGLRTSRWSPGAALADHGVLWTHFPWGWSTPQATAPMSPSSCLFLGLPPATPLSRPRALSRLLPRAPAVQVLASSRPGPPLHERHPIPRMEPRPGPPLVASGTELRAPDYFNELLWVAGGVSGRETRRPRELNHPYLTKDESQTVQATGQGQERPCQTSGSLCDHTAAQPDDGGAAEDAQERSAPAPTTCGRRLPRRAPRQGWGPEADADSNSTSVPQAPALYSVRPRSPRPALGAPRSRAFPCTQGSEAHSGRRGPTGRKLNPHLPGPCFCITPSW